MSGREGIFAGDDPFEISRKWLAEASEKEPSDPNAAALATVDKDGLPNVRVVLLKAIEDDAFVFFTNYESQKAQELESGKAAFVMHWKSLQRQVRVRGIIERETQEASDEYYQSRALGSRIGAWASQQSRPLASKMALAKAVAAAGIKHGTAPKRPPFWGGYRLLPVEFEFWAAGEFRLHDRFQWRRENPLFPWEITRLNP
ncbi:MAG: pyridoxamine 5'-phosphate oxidase [Halocynthiibacter sp.]|jgi:pyridoxamine 5'-phosphate oxidase